MGEHHHAYTSVLAKMEERKRSGGYLRICGPMVRYSKIAFRETCRLYGTDVAYTPMIISDVFKFSDISRSTEYRTNSRDNPVVVQFAASTPADWADATSLVLPYCSGVNLNCGCPQKWAIADGIGCALMEKPELVKNMVEAVQHTIKKSNVKLADGLKPTCSIKIRVHDDIRTTMDYVKRAEAAGVDYIVVHGRTRKQRSSEPVNLDAIKTIKEHASVPIFANGDVFTLEDADRIVEYTGVDGVMAARGLLENPALFAGHKTTPLAAIEAYTRLSIGYGTNYFIMHHHLMMMTEKSMSRTEKRLFNSLPSTAALLDFFESTYDLDFSKPASSE
ncbi:tRNA-dihydrouridine(20a/20b) synthase [NAD(P)+]-like protein [Chytriomyces hyalinus]|nr:tRNA-dihydrouridine(20a/20b) synthase [NAD(P)+]-like protein [Chytriomyces hyalinus]